MNCSTREHRTPRRRISPSAALGLAAGMFVWTAVSPASAVTFPNACKNNVTANNEQISVTLSATSPASVSAGGSVTLSNIQQTATVPGSVLVGGYNLGLLTVGLNTIPTTVVTKIEGTNTVEGTQDTNSVATSISTVITDPDGSPGTGDESATDGSVTVSYADQTWTAGASGTIEFREDTVPIGAGAGVADTGGLKLTETIAGFLVVRYGCSPGTVAGPDPGVVTLDDPAVSFASTDIIAANQAPTADAGPAQTVASGANVNLDGTGSSDPDGDPLDYSWTQTGGAAVTLSGADTATPSFTAPTGPATLTFQLEVCDGEPLCDTDTVVITVQELIPVFLGFLQPLPYEKLRSTSSISVKFQLGDDAGTPLSDEEALLRQTQVVLSANPNGSNPLALVTCLYSASKNRYQCSLKPPKNVAKYPTPYYITVLEQVGGSNVVAPTGATSATDNPLIIYFK